MNKLKQFSVFHPFLFAIFPVLFLFAYNIDEVPTSDLLLPMLVAIIGTLILLLSLRLITKNYNKIAIITSSFLILFFSYGHIRELIISYWRLGQERISVNLFLASLWALLFIIGAFLIIKSRRNFSTSTKFLNIVAITLVAISLINIGIYEVKTFNLMPETASERPTSLDLKDSHNLPDIYYIILDEYARADTLKEFWDYDNSEFIDYLTSKGFYVASKSRTNYSHTLLSLPSSLNMEYINYLSNRVTPQDETVLIKMMSNNKVSQFLKSKGYRYIFVTSLDWKGVDKYAEVLQYKGAFGIKISNFAKSLVRTTALAPFEVYFGRLGANEVLYVFDTLADIPAIKEPKFVFAYLCCPHPPFIFDRNGNLAKPSTILFQTKDPEKHALQIHQAYLEQLIFITKKVETLVDELLSKSDVPPVIILQADTGPSWYIQQPGRELTEETLMQERMKILNAYFLPDNGKRLLYESITPVNSFRIIFNLYFGTDYELLKDGSYYGSPHSGFITVPLESDTD